MPVTRGGRTKPNDRQERRCIATGESAAKTGLIRFVVAPDGTVHPDIAAKLPGRGLWVSANRKALDRAVRKNLFARAARRPVVVPDDLVLKTEALLARRLIELVSLARKSGQAIAGYEKVKGAVVSGSVAILLQARDGSAAQKAKIRPPSGQNTLISCLSGHELGLAFGRENVIHAALAAGGLTLRIVEDAARLAGVRKELARSGADDSGKGPEQIGV